VAGLLPIDHTLTQDDCPGIPEPEEPPHGHGGGSHPDACFQCWWEVQNGE